MKVFIVIWMEIDGKEVDCEVVVCMFFFFEKRSEQWGIVFFIVLYELDKIIFVNLLIGSFEVFEEEI